MLTVKGIDVFIQALEEFGNIEDVAVQCLEAAAPHVVKAVKNKIDSATTKGYSKGALSKSIQAKKPRRNDKGFYVVVTAEGTDSRGTRNNEKLAYLNYGTSKQNAIPILAPAVASCERDVLNAMQRKFDEVTK